MSIERTELRNFPLLAKVLAKVRKILPHPVWGIVVATLIAFSGRGELLLRGVGMLLVAFWLAADLWNWLLVEHSNWRWMILFGTTVTNGMLVAVMGIMWCWMDGKLADDRSDVFSHLSLSNGGEREPLNSSFTLANGSTHDIGQHSMVATPNMVVGNGGAVVLKARNFGDRAAPILTVEGFETV